MKYLLVGGIWIAYCFLHSFFISTWFTKIAARSLGAWYALYRIFYIIISVLLLVAVFQYTAQFDDAIVFAFVYPWSIIHSMMMYGSLLLFFWAFFFDYDALSFFGIRQALEYGKNANEKPASPLKRNGLLGVVRHPMYLALILFLWSHQEYKSLDILINVVLTGYVIIGTRLEETKLVLEFGESYKEYQREVPMLIPFIKPKAA